MLPVMLPIASWSQKLGAYLKSVDKPEAQEVPPTVAIQHMLIKTDFFISNPKNPIFPSKVANLRTNSHPCVIQVHSPFHWKVQGFLGKCNSRLPSPNPCLFFTRKRLTTACWRWKWFLGIGDFWCVSKIAKKRGKPKIHGFSSMIRGITWEAREDTIGNYIISSWVLHCF